MSNVLDLDRRILRIDFDDTEQVRSFLSEAQQQQAFMVPVDKAPKPLEVYAVEIASPGFAFDFEVRMVQLFPGGGTLQAAFQLEPWSAELEAQLQQKLEAPSNSDESETRGASPTFRIQQMNPNQRAILAMKADRTERRILRRDGSPQVLQNLLVNPRVDSEDVLAVVKAPNVNAGLLKRIADDRRWALNTEIRTAIARQPKTPPQLAVKLLDKLRTEDLRQMSKGGAVREQIRRAAYRVYLTRQRGR